MNDKLGEPELKVRVKCGAILKELDPSVPESEEIYRYRHTTLMGSSSRVVTKSNQKEEEVTGDKVGLRPSGIMNKSFPCFCNELMVLRRPLMPSRTRRV
jgi:hypothetical protein